MIAYLHTQQSQRNISVYLFIVVFLGNWWIQLQYSLSFQLILSLHQLDEGI